MVSWAGIKISCLVTQLTITKIVSNLENNGSLLMKFIEIEFQGYSDKSMTPSLLHEVSILYTFPSQPCRLSSPGMNHA